MCNTVESGVSLPTFRRNLRIHPPGSLLCLMPRIGAYGVATSALPVRLHGVAAFKCATSRDYRDKQREHIGAPKTFRVSYALVYETSAV
jgi:hypothetical protein